MLDALLAGFLVDSLRAFERAHPWRADAACLESDLDWFPTRGESLSEQRRVCAACLVQEECRAYALSRGQTLEGVWGGLSAKQRRQAGRRSAA